MPDRDSPESLTDLAVKIRNEVAAMSVFTSGHPLAPLRPHLATRGIVTAQDLRKMPSGKRVRVTGMLVIIHMPPTKSGKRVIFVTMEDETGLMDLVVFPRAQAHCAKGIMTSEVLTVEGKLQRQGSYGLSISVIVEKVLLPLTGKLGDFLGTPEASSPFRFPIS
jgi:DNA polymerase III alpha subunit